MGRVIAACVFERADVQIAAGVDLTPAENMGFPVFQSISACGIPADVIIDFSHPSALDSVLLYAAAHKLPAVIATTGLSTEQVDRIKTAANTIPAFWSGNMSLGINLLLELTKKATAVLSDFEVEIVEAHHNQKLDAPSGTAFMLADAVSSASPQARKYEYDRHSHRRKRDKNEIGIHSIRGGTIVGEHEVIFAGRDEIIKLSHSAQSKEIFAVGAINAARFLIGKPAGLYDMSDLVREC